MLHPRALFRETTVHHCNVTVSQVLSCRRRKRDSRLWSGQPPLLLQEKRRKENWEKERELGEGRRIGRRKENWEKEGELGEGRRIGRRKENWEKGLTSFIPRLSSAHR